MKPFKVIVCGGRDYNDREKIRSVLDTLRRSTNRPIVIIHGGAKGADSLAGEYVRRYLATGASNLSENRYPADWKRYGKAAGMIRNREMLLKEVPDLVIAFPGGPGTRGMIALAEKQGVPVKKYF